MIDVVESKKESPDLELQRRLRKDLQLEDSPVLDKGLRVFAAVIKFHLFFVGAWMFGSAISPAFGRVLGWMVSPFASIAFWLHPQYDVQRHFDGNMGFEFYRNIVGETFFVGVFLGLLFAVSYFGRYIRKPWRFSQYCLEQWRTKASWIGALVVSIFGALVSFAFGFWIAATYGLMAVPYQHGQIALFQLGLWSSLICSLIYMFILVFMLTFSSLCYLMKLMSSALVRH